MYSEIYEKINSSVSILSVIDRYGIKLNRQNYGLCPFHKEKTPSMKIYTENNSFYCFGCGAGGDTINFVAKIEHTNNYEAAKALNTLYNLGLDLENGKIDYRTIIQRKKKKWRAEQLHKWQHHAFLVLVNYRRKLWAARANPHSSLFVESFQNLETIDYYLDCLEQNPLEFYKINRKVVIDVERGTYGKCRAYEKSNSI